MQPLVIKCGGSVLEQLPESFYQNIVQLRESGEWQPVIVHGGGPLISSLLKKLEIPVQFVDGLRVTTEDVLDVVEMVLSGSVNKHIVRKLTQAGGKAVGISGVDGPILQAKPVSETGRLGFVGDVEQVHHEWLQQISAKGGIPVLSPLGIDASGQRYNINADTAASAVARALGAKLCFVSDIQGIYTDPNDADTVLPELTKEHAQQLIEEQVITGGMIPKVQAALEALNEDVAEAVIINGMAENQLLSFCEGKAVGTKVVLDEAAVKEGALHV